MLELATVIAAGAIAATFFSDILSRVVKGIAHMRSRGNHEAHA